MIHDLASKPSHKSSRTDLSGEVMRMVFSSSELHVLILGGIKKASVNWLQQYEKASVHTVVHR